MTVARTITQYSPHWYSRDKSPQFEVEKKDGTGMRKATIADARKNDWLPSVTTILQCLARPELERWREEMVALSVLTAPRKEGEELDAFVKRVLQDERQQDQESLLAREKGTRIHQAVEAALHGEAFDPLLAEFVNPAVADIRTLGRVESTEFIVASLEHGYAGRVDLLLDNGQGLIHLMDLKTTGMLPKSESWREHRLQTAAYAATIGNTGPETRIRTGNVYISTKDPGKVAMFCQDDWQETFTEGFLPLLRHWKWSNGF